MPIIGCKYPIEDINGFNIDQNKSWILLDNNSDNKIMEKVRNSCVIKTDKLGYEYLGDRYDGGYVIMQVADHPYSNQKEKVLYLNTNDSELLKSHILLRRVLLPSYIYGLHPYWNNAALIYCREGYKSVFEYGLKQEPIRKQVNNNG